MKKTEKKIVILEIIVGILLAIILIAVSVGAVLFRGLAELFDSPTSNVTINEEVQKTEEERTSVDTRKVEKAFQEYNFSFQLGDIFTVAELFKPDKDVKYTGNIDNPNDYVELVMKHMPTGKKFTVRASRAVPDECDRSPSPFNESYRRYTVDDITYRHYLNADSAEQTESHYSTLYRFGKGDHVCYTVSTDPKESMRIDDIDLSVLKDMLGHLNMNTIND